MLNIRKKLLTATLLAGLGLAAVAQPAPPQGGPGPQAGPGMEQRHGPRRFDGAQMQERMAQRQAALKQKLQLTPAQESAWATWTGTMKPPARMERPNREEMARLSTPERIDRMRAMRNQRLAEMDKRADATKAFYATLTPEQKKVFDQETAHGGRGGRHGGGHHHKG